MGKKKIIFLFIFMSLFNIQVFTQQTFMFTEKLRWKPQKEAVKELYESMNSFVCDTTPVVVKYDYSSVLNLINHLFTRRRIKKQLDLRKRMVQNETKNYVDSNFVFINDSVKYFRFKDKSRIIEWGESITSSPFVSHSLVHSSELHIKDNHVLILMVSGYSGIPITSFYVFRYKGNIWELQTTSRVKLTEKLIVKVDDDQEKILFETPSCQIGELPLEILLQ